MKKLNWLLCSILAFGSFSNCEALVFRIESPHLVVHQPIKAVIVESNGNSYERTVYYNPFLGGIDLNTTWAGPNASIYFPDLGTGYLWYNGYWVDPKGYYWNGPKKVYVNYPHWDTHWNHYWHRHWHKGWKKDWHREHKWNKHTDSKTNKEDKRNWKWKNQEAAKNIYQRDWKKEEGKKSNWQQK